MSMQAIPGAPRVVMFVANAFVHDTRVYKQARSLLEWGCEVHVIAIARKDLPPEEVQDGIFVHRVELEKPALRVLASLPLLLMLRSRWLLSRLLDVHVHRADPASADHAIVKAAAAGSTGAPEITAVDSADITSSRRTRLSVIRRLLKRNLAPVRSHARQFTRKTWRRITRLTRAVKTRLTPQAARLLRLNIRMAGRARDLRPDVVQSHDLNMLLAGICVKQLLGVPLVYDSHELYLERNIGKRSRLKDKLMWSFIEGFCIRRCDAVVSVAESICLHLAKQYGIPKPHLIRNVQPYEPPSPRTSILAEELGIDRDTRLIVYPGAITINRGLEMMIESAPYLDGAAFIIMGYAQDEAYLASLRQRAMERGILNDRVYFRDAVPIDDVLRYVASADLGVVPTQNACLSYYYESSNKMFHCLMAGVPLAMSDHAEKRLLAEQYGVGVLFDETDPRDIARTINGLLADPKRYEQLRTNCLEAARHLNWQHEEYTLRKVFARLIGERAPSVPAVSIPQAGPAPSSHGPGHPRVWHEAAAVPICSTDQDRRIIAPG